MTSGSIVRSTMKRPELHLDPVAGLLQAEHFQMAYATNDMERACDLFRKRLGIKTFRRLEGAMPSGGHIHVELAWVGNTMYELVSAEGPGAELYMSALPSDKFAIRHHHLGFLIHNDAQWQATLATVERDGWRLLLKNHTPGFMQSCFVDVPELGHYFEYLYPEPAGLEFLESVPSH